MTTEARNTNELPVRAIAFYLPQFHPVPENDEWWGKGFTEWRNVAKAKPLFPGHYQPHLPADLGFYDLRLPEVREAQAELARQHGIHGFCYYHYWFNGRRILERPFNEVLVSGKPDFPFCLCWANENWTRTWDGGDKHVLLEQNYSDEDDLAHIQSLIPAFKDPRYIRIDGKPLFLVYRTELLPDPVRTAQIWRKEAQRLGIFDLYLVRVESFRQDIDPHSIGFDAAVEFSPDGNYKGEKKFRRPFDIWLAKQGLIPRAYIEHNVGSYSLLAKAVCSRAKPSFTRFLCVTPSWDNSARRKIGAWIYDGSTPDIYGSWLRHAIKQTLHDRSGDERIVFINAWNEWAEGNHLEPDFRWGRAYLETTAKVLRESHRQCRETPIALEPGTQTHVTPAPSLAQRVHWRARAFVRNQVELVRAILKR